MCYLGQNRVRQTKFARKTGLRNLQMPQLRGNPHIFRLWGKREGRGRLLPLSVTSASQIWLGCVIWVKTEPGKPNLHEKQASGICKRPGFVEIHSFSLCEGNGRRGTVC